MASLSTLLRTLCALFFLCAPWQMQARTFTLAIANAHYKKPDKPDSSGFPGWSNVPDVIESARRFTALMKARTDSEVDTLYSTEQRPLSRKSILDAVEHWVDRLTRSGERDALLVLYYCGHGISDTVTHAMFLPAGDTYAPPKWMTIEERTEQLVSAGVLKQFLYDCPYQYMVLLDCCYDGETALSMGVTVAPQLVEHFTKTFIPDPEGNEKMLEYMYTEMLHEQNIFGMFGPGLFAAEPGRAAAVVPFRFPDRVARVGPLCARAFAISEANPLQHGVGMTVGEFVAAMVDPAQVPQVPPAFTGWAEVADPRPTAARILFTQ